MKRTTTRRRREMAAFYRENRRLFPFVGLFLLGVLLGVVVYITAGRQTTAAWGDLLRVSGIQGGLREGAQALWGSCFSTVLLLLLLYVLGLWACGAPFVLFVPLFHGLGLGLTLAYYYAMGWAGVGAVVTVIAPSGLLTAALLITAGAESLRLSTELSQQLLPAKNAVGAKEGLWPAFRLYSLRFLLFLVAAMAVGLVDVLLRTVLHALLP